MPEVLYGGHFFYALVLSLLMVASIMNILPFLRGIGAVVYGVPELKNDQLLKISLRSIDNEDTTPISQVVLNQFPLCESQS